MRQTIPAATFMLAAMTMSCLLDDDDGDGTNYVGINEIGDAYKEAQCTHLAECGLFPSREACLQAQLSGSIPSSFIADPNVEAAIYAGHIIYNGSNVKACIDAVATRSCDRTDQSQRVVPPECSGFFRGTLMAGEACFVDEECISQQCTGDSGNSCTPGACVGDTAPSPMPAQIGESCSTFGSCVNGAYCDTDTFMCEPLKSSGTVCIQDSECDYGLGCQGTTGSRVCGALPAIGQPCNVDGVCRDEGAYCDFNANMCKMYLQEGAQCGTAGSTCSLYYPCDFTATTPVCKQGPGVGQMCSSSTRCFDANTYCNFNQSPAVCAELKADGAFCGSGEECLSRNCDFEQQICASPMACL